MSLDLPQTEGAAGSWSLLRYGVYILGPSLFWVHVQMKCFLPFFLISAVCSKAYFSANDRYMGAVHFPWTQTISSELRDGKLL
uniref:Uncharacterized protein n=1 Tax=Anguilla anguilla TaxID=7936 RepID=A0A0E9VLZ7_ANGAN